MGDPNTAAVAVKKQKETMPLMEHISELRKRMVIVFIIAIIAFLVCFSFIKIIAEHMFLIGSQSGFQFVYLTPTELITTYLSLSLTLALVLTSPAILFETWLFVSPALDKPMKKYGRLAFVAGFLFFVAGAYFAYKFSLPFMLSFLVKYNVSEFITSSISVQSYVKFIISTLSVFGLIFEMPLLSFILSSVGILKPTFMKKARQFAVPIIFIVAAIITPPDVISQMIIGFPMVILYEVSIVISTMVTKFKNRKNDE